MTLPEITLTLAIVAIGTLLAVPSYQDWTARTDLKQATTEINSTLTLARVAAMNRNTTMTISLANVGNKVQVSSGGLMQPVLMGGHVTSFAGGPVSFNSLGLRAGGGVGNQLITLTNDQGLTYSVVVTPAGKVNWCMKATCP